MPDIPIMFNTSHAAALLDVHPHTLRRLIRSGRIRGVRTGNHWRVALAELERFAEEGDR